MSAYWKLYIRFTDLLAKAGMAVAGAACFMMMMLVSFDIITRNTLGATGLDAIELGGYGLVLITFGGIAYTFRTGGLIRVSVVYSRLSAKTRNCMDIVLGLMALGYAGLMCYYNWQVIFASIRTGARAVSVTRVPLQYPQMILGLGAAILVLVLIGYVGDRIFNLCGVDLGEYGEKRESGPVSGE